MAWVEKRLGDVCRLINGRAYKKHEMLPVGPYPLLRVGNFFTNRSWYYSDMELHPDKYCDDGDLLYAWSASFGPRIWDGGKVIYHYHIWKIEIDKELVDKNYLYYLLDWDKELIKSEQGAGTTMVHVTKGSMEKRLLPFPCLDEQKRIVAILDQTFADLEQVRAKTEQNLKNARELFDSYLQQVFSQRGEGWEDSTLGAISENLDNKRIPITKKDRIEGEYPYYGASGVVDYVDGYLFDERLLLVSEDGANLLARTYPIAFSAVGRYWVNNHAHVLRFNDLYTQKFIEYYLNSISLVPYVSGMAQPKLNQRSLNRIPVPKVTHEIAIEVVSKLEFLEKQINQVEKVYRSKIDKLDELKKSILQKAFSGELTAKTE